MIKMAIFKANFAKNRGAAKAAIRYIENRPGKDNRRTTRPLWGSEVMETSKGDKSTR